MGFHVYGWLVSFAAGMGGFLFGYEIGIINQVFTMDAFNIFFGLGHFDVVTKGEHPNQYLAWELVTSAISDDIKGWVTFTFLIGCAFGAVIVSWPSEYFGRRWTIQQGGAFFLLGTILQTGANNIGTLYAGRFIAGFGIGQMSNTVPLYIAETAETRIRGRLIAIYQLMITLGIFIASCVNSVIITYMEKTDAEWRLAFGIQMIPCFFMLVALLLLPFSPRWLMSKGRDAEAIKVLVKLRGASSEKDAIIVQEFEEIRAAIEEEVRAGEATWKELGAPGIRNRVALGVLLQFFQQWTGINVILYYGSDIFKSLKFDSGSSSISFVLASNAINVIFTLPGMWLMEKGGRRALLIWGGITIMLAHALITIFGVLSTKPGQDTLAWGSLVFIFVFIVAFSATWGPAVWVYQSEIFPLRVRSKGTSMSTVSNWVWNAIISKIFPFILTDIQYYTYIIFAIFGLAMTAFVFFFVPETKGKPLEDLDVIFNGSIWAHRKSPNRLPLDRRESTTELTEVPIETSKDAFVEQSKQEKNESSSSSDSESN
jgi:sugar porter (SP) family MFS transporter